MAKVWFSVLFQHFSASGLRKAWNWSAYWEVLQVSEEEALERLQTRHIDFNAYKEIHKLTIYCWYCLKLLHNKTSSPETSPWRHTFWRPVVFLQGQSQSVCACLTYHLAIWQSVAKNTFCVITKMFVFLPLLEQFLFVLRCQRVTQPAQSPHQAYSLHSFSFCNPHSKSVPLG